MKKTILSALALGLLAWLRLSAAQTASPEIPVETLFQTPAMGGLEFSPDGKKILVLVPYKGRQNLAVIDLEKGTKNLLSSFEDKDAIGPFWANDERILFFVDDDGKEQYDLYAVNADGKEANQLEAGKNMMLIQRLRSDKKNILVGAGINNADWMDLALMNVQTGKINAVLSKAPGNVQRYVIDHNDVARFAVVYEWETQTNKIFYRDSNKSAWQQVASNHVEDEGWTPLEFDGDNKTVFISSNIGRKTDAIFTYDTEAKSIGKLVFADDTYDVFDVVYDASKNKVVGVSYSADRHRFYWLDAEMAAIHAKLEKSLPNTVHVPTRFSRDGSKIIFYSYSDKDPGVYYLFDRKRQKLDELAVLRPKIDPEQMASTQAITYKARDGLQLHGYLTLPAGAAPKKLPLIIHPHGGPYGIRDEWIYNPEVQFYANRGFAVLQINYRGSGGYGKAFEEIGYKKWGLEMQDDISDGVNWAVSQGIADPKRVVISGASYGGYATMAGLVFTPELYCAGINYVGVVDIANLIPRGFSQTRLYDYNRKIGDLLKAEDRKRLKETSPVNFADRIRVPLLMAYGKNDPRVTVDQAYDIESALKRANVPYKLIIESKEGHGFHKEEKRIAFYGEIDAFLKKYVLNMPDGVTRIPDFKVIESPAKKVSH